MPSGKQHININFIIFSLAATTILFIFNETRELAFCASGYFVGTFLLNPDLDIKSKPYKNWKFLRFIWIPYQRKIKHRSVWSHGYVIGDVVRYLYLTVIISIPLFVFVILGVPIEEIFSKSKYIATHYNEYLLMFFLGNVISSSLHTISDRISK